MAYKDITVEKRGRIVCMTLNRPERMNSISVETGNVWLGALGGVVVSGTLALLVERFIFRRSERERAWDNA